MATAAPIFPMAGHSQFDYFCFDPQIDYAQVLTQIQISSLSFSYSIFVALSGLVKRSGRRQCILELGLGKFG